MKRVATALLLLGAWVSAPALAADEPEVYSASTTGEITVDVEGRVTALVLDHKELGADVMRAFEDKVRGWQFEPVLRDGAPVPAKARMTLELLLVRQVGVENLGIAFEDVQFFDPVERKVAEGVSASLAPPRYPEESLRSGIGARVSLVLKLDADGRVIDVAAQEVNLLGEESGHQRDRHAREFTRAAVRAASEWRIPGVEGGLVVVPAMFVPQYMDGKRWVRTHGVVVDVPAWVVAERASRKALALGSGGAKPSDQWKLVTPLEG